MKSHGQRSNRMFVPPSSRLSIERSSWTSKSSTVGGSAKGCPSSTRATYGSTTIVCPWSASARSATSVDLPTPWLPETAILTVSVEFVLGFGRRLLGPDAPGDDVGSSVALAFHRYAVHAAEHAELPGVGERVGESALEELLPRSHQRSL